jgi:hypothetical protein
MNGRESPFPTVPGPSPRRHVLRHDNPLNRPSDRLWFWVQALLIVVLAVGSVTAGSAAGNAGYSAQSARVQQEHAERHRVAARVMTDAENSAVLGEESLSQSARVRWADHSGETQTDTAPVPDGADEGERVTIWVDRSGTVTGPPDPASSPAIEAWATAMMAAGAVVTVALTVRSGLRRIFDRHNYRCWETEWAAVEPEWSGRDRH